MKKKEMIYQMNSDFYKFLVDNDILEKYIFNFEQSHWNRSLKSFLDIRKYSYIKGAFNWIRSSEGHDFWKNYNRKWLLLYPPDSPEKLSSFPIFYH
jgi:hypothetical protein